MYSKFYSPNILATGSSELDESSYSVSWGFTDPACYLIQLQYENDADIGVAVIDRYTHLILSFLEGINKTSQATMQQMVSSGEYVQFWSH
jgi:GPI-anchor transamidase subunit K